MFGWAKPFYSLSHPFPWQVQCVVAKSGSKETCDVIILVPCTEGIDNLQKREELHFREQLYNLKPKGLIPSPDKNWKVHGTKVVSKTSTFVCTLYYHLSPSYGELSPSTFPGKLIGGLCALCGIFILTLPIPIVVNRYDNTFSWLPNSTDVCIGILLFVSSFVDS